jgi:hypothetical protein
VRKFIYINDCNLSRVLINNKSDSHLRYLWQTGYGQVFLGYCTPIRNIWMNGKKDYCWDLLSYGTLYCSELL